MSNSSPSQQPLAGVLVLDCTVTIPGPYATALLRRFGARVIKIEPPSGDITRMFAHLHDPLNVGKESVVADLKTEAGIAIVLAIARRADVFIEGWRPGVADRLGLGRQRVRAQNESIVYCSLSGYGAEGELRDRPGHDLNYVAASGAMRMMFGDERPESISFPVADLAGGTFAALRICAGLVEAKTTGRGTFIDASLGGAVRDWVEAIGGGVTEQPVGTLGSLPHYGVFETIDGHYLTIGIVNEDHFWHALCRSLNLEDLQNLTFLDRATRTAELRAYVAKAVNSRTRAELERALASADTAWAFVDSPVGTSSIGGMIANTAGRVRALGEDTTAVRAEFLSMPETAAPQPADPTHAP